MIRLMLASVAARAVVRRAIGARCAGAIHSGLRHLRVHRFEPTSGGPDDRARGRALRAGGASRGRDPRAARGDPVSCARPTYSLRLQALAPAYALIVVAPEDLDVNLQYELLDVLSRIDDDPFVDCRYGFIHRPHAGDRAGVLPRAPKRCVPIRRGCRIKHSRSAGRTRSTTSAWFVLAQPLIAAAALPASRTRA